MDWDLKLGRVIDEGTASVERVARRRRTTTAGGGGQVQPVTCLVDGCTWDLTSCREYHRRHRVCENHSKTPVVLVAGLEQRFCQQCSRFHSLGEFDEAKRSCRKRLDGHNRRRRKSNPLESSYLRSASSSPAATTPPPPPPTTTLFPPPPLFHHLRHPPLPPSMYPPPATIPWQVTAPSPLFPQPSTPSPSFGYLSRHHDHESTDNRGRGDGGHIDCALSLLSSGTLGQGGVGQQHLDWQQQQGFDGGDCTASASQGGGGGSDCYGFDDDDESDGAPCRMFPFSWD